MLVCEEDYGRIWHSCLDHLNDRGRDHDISLGNILNDSMLRNFCLVGMTDKLPKFSRSTVYHSSLSLILSDLVGGGPSHLIRKLLVLSSYVNMVDATMKFNWVYLMNHECKLEVYDCFTRFNMIENQFS